MLYEVMAYTGLRLNEARTLTWANVDISFPRRHVTVTAQYAKSRTEASVPLFRRVAAKLRLLRRHVQPAAADRVLHVPKHALRHFHGDRAFAEIDYEDDQGRRAVMHSLRKTTATMLARAGVHPSVMMQVMRHKDIRQTMEVYTELRLVDVDTAVQDMPRLPFDESTMRANETNLMEPGRTNPNIEDSYAGGASA